VLSGEARESHTLIRGNGGKIIADETGKNVKKYLTSWIMPTYCFKYLSIYGVFTLSQSIGNRGEVNEGSEHQVELLETGKDSAKAFEPAK
jgi:hypothetical protein